MTTEEKIIRLNEYNGISVLTEEDFLVLTELSFDKDSYIRSLVAPLLVDFINEKSKVILLRLAQDEDLLVRTEAYDSLAAFSFADVASFLETAVKAEKDYLARSYAILSWIDVSLSLHYDVSGNIVSLKKLKNKETSALCQLSYSYALYMCGENGMLEEILSFFMNDDYHVRCAAIALLGDIIDESNETHIKEAIAALLITEDTVAVKDRAQRFLKEN